MKCGGWHRRTCHRHRSSLLRMRSGCCVGPLLWRWHLLLTGFAPDSGTPRHRHRTAGTRRSWGLDACLQWSRMPDCPLAVVRCSQAVVVVPLKVLPFLQRSSWCSDQIDRTLGSGRWIVGVLVHTTNFPVVQSSSSGLSKVRVVRGLLSCPLSMPAVVAGMVSRSHPVCLLRGLPPVARVVCTGRSWLGVRDLCSACTSKPHSAAAVSVCRRQVGMTLVAGTACAALVDALPLLPRCSARPLSPRIRLGVKRTSVGIAVGCRLVRSSGLRSQARVAGHLVVPPELPLALPLALR
jgi:hypothetical protein